MDRINERMKQRLAHLTFPDSISPADYAVTKVTASGLSPTVYILKDYNVMMRMALDEMSMWLSFFSSQGSKQDKRGEPGPFQGQQDHRPKPHLGSHCPGKLPSRVTLENMRQLRNRTQVGLDYCDYTRTFPSMYNKQIVLCSQSVGLYKEITSEIHLRVESQREGFLIVLLLPDS